MVMKLDGPRRPARSGTARSLVVLLHGYGASGDDLIGLADELALQLRDAAFASPHAVEEMPYPGQAAYQWFALTARDPEEYAAGARAAGDRVPRRRPARVRAARARNRPDANARRSPRVRDADWPARPSR